MSLIAWDTLYFDIWYILCLFAFEPLSINATLNEKKYLY